MASADRLIIQQIFQVNIRKITKSALLGICEGKPLVTGGFRSQRDSKAEIVSSTTGMSCSMCSGLELINLVTSLPCLQGHDGFAFREIDSVIGY